MRTPQHGNRGCSTWDAASFCQLFFCQQWLVFGRVPKSRSLSDVLPRSGLEPCCTEVPLTIPDSSEAQGWITLETHEDGVRDVTSPWAKLSTHFSDMRDAKFGISPLEKMNNRPGGHSQTQAPSLTQQERETRTWHRPPLPPKKGLGRQTRTPPVVPGGKERTLSLRCRPKGNSSATTMPVERDSS